MKAKAYAALAANKALESYSIERREPGAHDVAIDIAFCGVCHSDIHTARNEWRGSIYPVIPGHEIVGKVTRIGSSVTKHKVGDIVGVGCMVDSCQKCHSCNDHFEQYCATGFTGTYNSKTPDSKTPTYGGYSSHIVVKEDFVLRIGHRANLAAVAPLLCAGITTYSPLAHVGLKKGDKIAIVGLGGLGHMGVKIAASMGAEVTVISGSASKENDANRLGAQHFIHNNEPKALGKYAGHFDYVLDTVSFEHDINALVKTIKRDGTLIVVGVPENPLALEPIQLILGRRSILGSLIGGIKETQDMLDHCEKHNIVSDIELIKASQINEAYERIIAGKVKYRFVIDCSTL